MFLPDHVLSRHRGTRRSMHITWYGHSAFRLDFAGKAVLIDPYATKVIVPDEGKAVTVS
jgi:L-ascorbate metabolism protein UlaG (beta-lactamase superfamily)